VLIKLEDWPSGLDVGYTVLLISEMLVVSKRNFIVAVESFSK
jgi:hypothetical protein